MMVVMVPSLTLFVVNISNLKKKILSSVNEGFYN